VPAREKGKRAKGDSTGKESDGFSSFVKGPIGRNKRKRGERARGREREGGERGERERDNGY
jgi:hypothetical protein